MPVNVRLHRAGQPHHDRRPVLTWGSVCLWRARGWRMANLPTGTVTFLFTDIEGSTPFWEREPEQMRLALARHHAILRTTIATENGHVFKTIGDAFQAAFALPAHALAAALAAQRAFVAETWETSEPIRVRMGVHVGSAVVDGND